MQMISICLSFAMARLREPSTWVALSAVSIAMATQAPEFTRPLHLVAITTALIGAFLKEGLRK